MGWMKLSEKEKQEILTQIERAKNMRFCKVTVSIKDYTLDGFDFSFSEDKDGLKKRLTGMAS